MQPRLLITLMALAVATSLTACGKESSDAAHAAKDAWGRTSAAARADVLNAIADRMQANLDLLALAETWDNGKPNRETTAADIPPANDHFRHFPALIRPPHPELHLLTHTAVLPFGSA